MSLKIRIAKKIPPRLLNNLLLSFPFLYKPKFINYESYSDEDGIRDLIGGLNMTRNLPGNIIECGCARCGTGVILAKYLEINHIDKKYYALDAFQGFKEEELEREKDRGFTKASSDSFTYNSYNYVLKKISKLGLSERLFVINGYFEETLAKIDSRFCMGLIDCDLSETITYVAETIWPRLVNDGFLFFDDYGFENFKGVTHAVDKFVQAHNRQIGYQGKSGRLFLIKKSG